jgi:hypothetical protein
MKTCQWCDASFEPNVGYQIYCSSECREAATKEKISQRYLIARRNRLMSKKRKCKACGSSLSAYNDDQLCQICIVNPLDVSKALKEIKGIADGKSKLDD